MQGKPFHVLNRVLDGAIGSAVQSYATEKALEIQRRRQEYLAFVAHDLRTPLNAIALSVKVLELLLAQNNSTTPETTQKLNTLTRNVRRVHDFIGKILEENLHVDSEDGVKLERREIDLWPLVETIIHELHPVAGSNTTRLTNSVADDIAVYADANLIRRVLQNLIANAINYAPRGEVIIGAQVIEIGVECFVRDNGEGIPPGRCSTVFDKHETDPDKEGGLGLGLAIVKTFVEAHGGTVLVESELGVGTVFRFTLPRKG